MEIVFFCKDDKSCPTEQFLISRYGSNLNSFTEEIVKIGAAWFFALEKKGICDGGNYIEKLSGYDALCIRAKRSKILIRFPFYRDENNGRLVLLLGFFKIDGYKPRGKTDRDVKRKLEEAQEYYDEYNKNNNKYKVTRTIKNILMIKK